MAAACNTASLTPQTGIGGTPGGTPNPAEDDDPDLLPDGGTPPADDEAGPPKTVGIQMTKDVSIVVEPSDKGAALLAAIKGAKTSVHLTMYLLTDNTIVEALGDLHDAGKDVQVTLNHTFPPDSDDNSTSFAALTQRGVDVKWASPTYTYTHAKVTLIDGATAIIMTMNMTESSAATNREYIATDTDADDVATLEKIFAADHAGTPITVASKLVISPLAANTSGGPRDYLTSFINSAKTSLDVEVQELSDYAIVDAIIAQNKAGLKLHLIVDGDVSTTNAELTVIAKLKSNGIPVHSFHSPDLHAKAIVVDGVQTWVGSQNFTATALDANREVGLFTDTATEVAKVKNQIDADYQTGAAL